jgi:hypothetical protein
MQLSVQRFVKSETTTHTPINPVSHPNSIPPNDAIAVSVYAFRYVLISRHTEGKSSFAMIHATQVVPLAIQVGGVFTKKKGFPSSSVDR